MRLTLLALGALLLGACAGGPQLRELAPSPAVVELDATPFFAQDEYQCGPAALATALGASGVQVTPDELVPRIYVPERRGTLQSEIIATARSYGRVPYPINTALEELLAELAAGQAVLVLQNLGFSFWPAWHYAVVIGYDTDRDELLLRSGTEDRLRTETWRFDRSWKLAQRWGLVLARPNQPPATATVESWLAAASAFEELGQPELAETAYEAAVIRWPDQALAWQLLGNARYGQGNLKGSEAAFRSALSLVDSPAARNNLAHVLLERGCPRQALAELELAAVPADGPIAALERTREEIHGWRGVRSADCPD